MPIDKSQRQQLRMKRQAVLRDLVRATAAGVSEPSERKSQIEQLIKSLALPESDAAWFWNKMQRDRWRFSGIPITDWRATIPNWHKHGFFPSQRK